MIQLPGSGPHPDAAPTGPIAGPLEFDFTPLILLVIAAALAGLGIWWVLRQRRAAR